MILTVFLVTVEALAELALPKCMEEMVNFGIQKKGIENYTPIIIDSQTKRDIINLTPKKDISFVLNSYEKLVNKEQLNQNKNLKNIDLNLILNDEIYIIKKMNKEEAETLNKILFNVFSMIYCQDNLKVKGRMITGTNLTLKKPIIDQISELNENKREKIIEKINKNIFIIDSNLLSDIIVDHIEQNYKDIGVDIKTLQDSYIKDKSVLMFFYIIVADFSWVLILLMTSVCSAGIARDLKKDLFNSVINFSKTEIDKISISSLITRTTNDVSQIQSFLFFTLTDIFFAPIFGIVAFKNAYKINTDMSWIIVVIISVMLVINILILWLVVPKYNIIQKLIDKMNLIIRENLNGLLSVRAFNKQKFEEDRFKEVNTEFKDIRFFIEKVMTTISPMISFIISISEIAIAWFSYKYVLNYSIQIGSIMVYINYTMSVIFSFLMLSMTIIGFPRAHVSSRRIFEVLETKPLITDSDIIYDDKVDFKGKLTFKNVSFKYQDSSEYILKNISFTAEPGKTTAIIGSTGSGKSTIVNLIPRFYDVTDGEILLDGVNIKNLSQHKLRQQISYIPQKGVLFEGTIESNIKYGNKNASNQKVEEVAKIAQAEDFINKKADKFLSEISQGGTNVSGGQRQRLSIARAIMKKSKIYLFDDSFSALDFKTDLELRRALNEYIKDATIIIVAQRIGTILNADQIIVLNEGRVVGKGSHSELIKNCKEYYEIAVNQLPSHMLKK